MPQDADAPIFFLGFLEQKTLKQCFFGSGGYTGGCSISLNWRVLSNPFVGGSCG